MEKLRILPQEFRRRLGRPDPAGGQKCGCQFPATSGPIYLVSRRYVSLANSPCAKRFHRRTSCFSKIPDRYILQKTAEKGKFRIISGLRPGSRRVFSRPDLL